MWRRQSKRREKIFYGSLGLYGRSIRWAAACSIVLVVYGLFRYSRKAAQLRAAPNGGPAAPETHALCEAVQDIPPEAAHRRWTLRADNYANVAATVNLSESPLFLELHWRATAVDAPRLVGVFRLKLHDLVRDGYIRHEPVGSHGSDVRVRVVQDVDGSFYVQTNREGPRLLLANGRLHNQTTGQALSAEKSSKKTSH